MLYLSGDPDESAGDIGCCGSILMVLSFFLVFVTLPFSLFFCIKVILLLIYIKKFCISGPDVNTNFYHMVQIFLARGTKIQICFLYCSCVPDVLAEYICITCNKTFTKLRQCFNSNGSLFNLFDCSVCFLISTVMCG